MGIEHFKQIGFALQVQDLITAHKLPKMNFNQ